MLAAQSAAATGAARSQLCTSPWPVDRLTTMPTSEWLTRKKAAMATTQTTARAGRNTPGSGWPPNSSERCSRSTRPAETAAATATDRMYWGTLNSRLTGWGSNSAWLTAIPTPVAMTSTGGSRKTTPSTITMSQVPTEKRWLRIGTLTTNRSARTSPATYSSGCQAARPPPSAAAGGRGGGGGVQRDDDRGRGHDRQDEQPGGAWERGPDALGGRPWPAHHGTPPGSLRPGGRRPVPGPGPGGRCPAGPGPGRSPGRRDTDSTRVHGDSSPLRVRPGGGGVARSGDGRVNG